MRRENRPITTPTDPACSTARVTRVLPVPRSSSRCRAVVRTPGPVATQVNDRLGSSSVTMYSVGGIRGCSTRTRDPTASGASSRRRTEVTVGAHSGHRSTSRSTSQTCSTGASLIVTKRDAGLAGSTIRTIYTVLRSALDIAARDGLIRSNPAAAVKRPGVERKDAPHLTAEQAQAIRGGRLETLFRVMLATGLRRGEALALRWSDVDLDAGLLRVRWTLSRTSMGLQLHEPKTDKSRRTVPLPRSAIETLRAHRTRQREDQSTAAGAWQEHRLVFTTEIGTPLEPRNVLRRFKVLARSEPASAAS